uniref:Potassium transporter n=1 Tax=Kalanchoe fedtschenkoi TaxID=63787 RepID=A0A7N0TH18_KALFE
MSAAAATEQGITRQAVRKVSCSTVLTLAYQSLGVIYGDLSTSPLYVYKTAFSGKLSLKENDEEIYGFLCFIFWTLTLVALCKYIFIVMSADDNGEGGTFALYSLLCRHARLSILPNQLAMDENLSAYATTARSEETRLSSALRSAFEKNPKYRTGLLIFVLIGSCMAIGDGVFTPSISVLSAVSGMRIKLPGLHENYVVVISCCILVGLFSLQHHGTHRVSFAFAPIVTAWLLSISSIGVYNVLRWNPRIYRALSPVYMLKFLRGAGVEGWKSLGGVVLSIAGVETMFADLGHLSCLSIKIAFTCLVYPCLVLAYMGEAAFLSRHHGDIQRSFYKAIPEAVFWPVFIIATLAAVVGSQAVISATFSLVSQCYALNCFPRVRIVHTSSKIYGQIYIPEINWILMCLCVTLTVGVRDTNMLGHAYGLSVTTLMFVTTCLMTMVIVMVWKQQIPAAAAFLLLFGSVELLYMSACYSRVAAGGWISFPSFLFMGVMYVWNYGTMMKHHHDMENKVSMERILSLGPSLGMIRVPGIGLVYTNLAAGVPAIFGHLVANLPAFHQVLVFVCVKSVQVPYVGESERFLIGRVGPREYGMFRCVVRYGYRNTQQDIFDFENKLVSGIIGFIESEDASVKVPASDEMLVQVQQFEKPPVKPESLQISAARESGVAYILGHSHAKAKEPSSVVRKLAINAVLAFLAKNCREPDVTLNVPRSSLLEVGMIYYV